MPDVAAHLGLYLIVILLLSLASDMLELVKSFFSKREKPLFELDKSIAYELNLFSLKDNNIFLVNINTYMIK